MSYASADGATRVKDIVRHPGAVAVIAQHADGRLVLVRLTPSGRRLMKRLFPEFNAQEQVVVSAIPRDQLGDAAEMLRRLCTATGD